MSIRDFQYVAWFRSHTLKPDDQDYEWCACFVVVAEDENAAGQWGDQLARDYSGRSGTEEFLRSHFDSHPWKLGEVARVTLFEKVPDEVIGW